MISRFIEWNIWRKNSLDSKVYKLFVLFGLTKSPTFEFRRGWYHDELIQCSDCRYLDVINSNETYARCKKHGFEFLPFADDTRKCFCSWAERTKEQ